MHEVVTTQPDILLVISSYNRQSEPLSLMCHFNMVNNGATILELEWEPIEGNVQRVCVGWIGGIVKTRAAHRSETSHQDHLDKMPQSFVGVHVVEAVPIARQMSVEPSTPDDWELIQLHAGGIETVLLRQVCVVNDKQVIPIWVNQNAVIRIRASLPDGVEYARLTSASEVIVAPKERQSQATTNGLSSDLYYEQSPPLVVQVQHQ
uniref:Peroxisomal ATPase PEX1 N-terminal C-lobe domain-containing protein n=1 Tax=Hyaloperonospora arabidopsidis (strain Emoy2) TaxID=559515 RepID=M4BRU0_HYAAE